MTRYLPESIHEAWFSKSKVRVPHHVSGSNVNAILNIGIFLIIKTQPDF